MAYTRSEWNRIQRNLPVEERSTYEEYLASTRGSVSTGAVPTAESVAAKMAAGDMPDANELIVLNQSITGAQAPSAAEAASLNVNPSGTTGTPNSPGRAWTWNGMEFTQPAMPTDGKKYTWDDNLGWVVETPAVVVGGDGGDGGGGGGNGNPLTAADVATMIAEAVANARKEWEAGAAASAAEDKQAVVSSALDEFRLTLKENGLGDLVDSIDRMIKDNKTASEIKLAIRKEPAYEKRFPGMAALSAKNRAITEGEYISMERGYEQVLRAYGLNTDLYGARDDLGNYISNEVSAKEFEDRVSMAANRVAEQPDVINALGDIYGVDKSDAIGYLLNPEKAMNAINKQVRASEIAAAALSAKFTLGQTSAERAAQAEAYIAASGTSDLTGLRQTFGRARTLATTQQRLAYLENQSYNEMEAVNVELAQDQEAILASQKRAARETARFGGSSGVGGSYSLRRESSI